MRVAISVVALVLVAALGLPAGAVEPAPHITDPAGDANALNGQGLVTGSAAQGTSTPVGYAPADLLAVRYATAYKAVPVGGDGLTYVQSGLEAHITTAAPATSAGPTLIYRLNVEVGSCGGFVQYYLNGPASGPTDGTTLEFRQLASTLGVDPAALGEVDASAWIDRLGGSAAPAGQQINTAVAMERVGAILESYSQAFVELRKGYEQFGEEMALQLVQERTPLRDAQSGQEVLDYLLDWGTDGGERVRELTRAFADLALHQVALLSGVMEGVRSLLGTLSPQQLSGQKNYPLAKSGGGGLLEGIFNSKKASLWRTFADTHQRLAEEDRFSREVFGRNFARAYSMVTGGHMQGNDGSGGGPDRTAQHGYHGSQTSPYNQ